MPQSLFLRCRTFPSLAFQLSGSFCAIERNVSRRLCFTERPSISVHGLSLFFFFVVCVFFFGFCFAAPSSPFFSLWLPPFSPYSLNLSKPKPFPPPHREIPVPGFHLPWGTPNGMFPRSSLNFLFALVEQYSPFLFSKNSFLSPNKRFLSHVLAVHPGKVLPPGPSSK